MKVQTFDSRMRLLRIMLSVVCAVTFASSAGAQDEEKNIRTIQQGLVGGPVVSPEMQEQYGLLSLDTGCSASLLRNNWAITAAHCVDNPDPDRTGGFITVSEDSVTLIASWKTNQLRKSMRIISFRPMDIAIIRVANPFSVGGSNRAYNREIFRGALVPVKITAFGRGIFQLAQGSGTSAMRSRGDNQYRVGYFTIDEEGDGEYSYPSVGGQSLAGGDSGGPSFTKVPSGEVLVGVHSAGPVDCLPGKTCGEWPGPGPAPAGYSNWDWISATPRTTDASIAAVWDEIDRYLGAFVPTPLPEPIRAQGRVPGTTPNTSRPICDLAREARARNNPAAPGLEEKCRAEQTIKAIGRVTAPAGTTPNTSRPICESARLARERNNPAAPGLEEKCRVELAAKGKVIAEADAIVGAARNAQPDEFYRFGFDIATAIFGNPALGAQGNTQTGPGSLGIRARLTDAGQRGFDASVALHLSRNYERTFEQTPESGTGSSEETRRRENSRSRGGPLDRKRDSRRTEAVFQPENTIKVSVRYRKEFGYKEDTNAFGYVGPTSCSAFSVSVVVGDGSAQRLNPIRVSSDSKMVETDGHYFCSYLVSFIPLNQPIRVSVGMSGLDHSGAWKGGSYAQPLPGQQRTIIIVSGREGGPLTLTATQPRARQLFEMVYTSQPR